VNGNNGAEADETDEVDDVLDEEEVKQILRALARTHGGRRQVTEEMAEKALDWARAVRRLSVALALVLAGEMDLRISSDGQITFELNEEAGEGEA